MELYNDGKISVLHSVQTGSEVHPASHSMGTGDKAVGASKADHSTPSSADFKNG
jgi:hypothetical protein